MNFPATHNMFFIAIMCPQDLDKKILQFKLWIKEHFGAVVALKSPAHITLIQPFWMDMNKENLLINALNVYTSHISEIEIYLDGFSRLGKKLLFITVQENPSLEEIKKHAEIHFAGYLEGVVKKDDRPFHPHITISNRDLKPGDSDKAWQHFENKFFKESFHAKAISLLRLEEGKWNVIGEKKW